MLSFLDLLAIFGPYTLAGVATPSDDLRSENRAPGGMKPTLTCLRTEVTRSSALRLGPVRLNDILELCRGPRN